MYNQFFTIKPRISEKNGGSKVVHLIESIAAISSLIMAHLEERKAKLEHYWAEYNEVQSRLESLDESEGCDRERFRGSVLCVIR